MNTFLALFLNAGKGGIYIPTSAAISPPQWLLSYGIDLFVTFIGLTRLAGVPGVLLHIGKIEYRHLASIGAYITIISALTSTNLIKGDNMCSITQKKKKRHINGTVMDSASTFLEPLKLSEASCSTVNCPFKRYESLGARITQAHIFSSSAY